MMRTLPRTSLTRCFVAPLVAVGLLTATAAAKDWPQFRGPNRDGRSTETGLLTEWPKDGPPLAWRIEGLGKGYSSVAIASGRIFTMGDRRGDMFVIALDRATHKEVWATLIGEKWDDGGPRCTPTIDGEFLYAIGPHGDLACLRADNGKEVWRKNLAKDFGGEMMSGWGYSESPLIDGDKLVCTPGGRDAAIVALDKKSGKTAWKAALPDLGSRGRDGAGYSSIVISEAGGIRQYVQTLGRGTVGVAADDGRFLWGYNKIANQTANIPVPVVSGNYVFCTTSYETGSALLELKPTDNGKGIKATEVYFLGPTQFENHHGGVILLDGYIYGGHGRNNGTPTCIEMKTGKIAWKDRGPGRNSAAITYADGRFYFRYEDGTVALIEAKPAALKVVSSFKLPTNEGPSWPYPVVCDGRLYLRHGDSLLCYDIKAK